MVSTRGIKRSESASGGGGGKKSKTEDLGAAANSFDSASFVAPLVMQYLGTQSLVRFSSTSKHHRTLLDQEVTRRKARFHECEQEVKQLLAVDDYRQGLYTRTRSDIMTAKKLCKEARDLIDSELDWQDRFRAKGFDEDYSDAPDPLFHEQRQALLFVSNEDTRPPLCMLPTCFYLSPLDETVVRASGQSLARVRGPIDWLWENGRSRMPSVYYFIKGHPYYDDPRYPLRKFEYGLARFFVCGCVDPVVDRFWDDPAIRVAARELAYFRPGAEDCMHFLLSLVDERILGGSEDEGESISD